MEQRAQLLQQFAAVAGCVAKRLDRQHQTLLFGRAHQGAIQHIAVHQTDAPALPLPGCDG